MLLLVYCEELPTGLQVCLLWPGILAAIGNLLSHQEVSYYPLDLIIHDGS